MANSTLTPTSLLQYLVVIAATSTLVLLFLTLFSDRLASVFNAPLVP